MITIEDFEAEPSRWIYLVNGTITYDSRLENLFLGDLKLLFACIEDHTGDEEINYYEAIKDYNKSVKSA